MSPMTSNAEETAAEEDFDIHGPDSILEFITKIVNDSDLGLPVTLTVNGVIVSGLLISGKQYFNEAAEVIEGGTGSSGVIEVMANLHRDVAKRFEELVSKDEDEPMPPVRFVHLNKAHILSSGGAPIEVGLWRGKLSAVDGWTFGAFSTS